MDFKNCAKLIVQFSLCVLYVSSIFLHNAYADFENLPEVHISDLYQIPVVPVMVDDIIIDENTVDSLEKIEELRIDENSEMPFLKKYEGKWVILDVSATWCGYCAADKEFFSYQRNELQIYDLNGYKVVDDLWGDKVVQVHLTIESSNQTLEIIRKDLVKAAKKSNVSMKGVDTYFYETEGGLSKFSNKFYTSNNINIFEGARGYPYQLVFNPEGTLVFRGFFTSKLDGDENGYTPYRRHYRKLDQMVKNYE